MHCVIFVVLCILHYHVKHIIYIVHQILCKTIDTGNYQYLLIFRFLLNKKILFYNHRLHQSCKCVIIVTTNISFFPDVSITVISPLVVFLIHKRIELPTFYYRRNNVKIYPPKWCWTKKTLKASDKQWFSLSSSRMKTRVQNIKTRCNLNNKCL